MKSLTPRLGSAFESLEDRTLPTTFGVPWADPEHLTLSFAADGTMTPFGANSLARTLAPAGTTPAWQREILRAFQTWAAHANINIGLVADGGQALGSVGAVQGDRHFGDIRIAAARLSPDVLASASPFSWTGTTFSGDMVLNSDAPYSIGGAGYDLYSVAVHEAGHAFGVGHANEQGGPCGCDGCRQFESVMNAVYARQTGLSAEDIAAIQKLYGARKADAYDAAGDNDTRARASSMQRMPNGQLLVTGDLTTMADVDYYKFTAPALTSMLSGVYVRLKAAGISLLNAKISVLDSAGRVLTSATSTDPLNNDLIVNFRPGLFGGSYTVKVEGAKDDVFGVGGYKLAVDFLSVGGLLFPITNLLTGVLDGGTNETLSSATGLPSNASNDARFDAIYRGVIESSRDVDTYRVRTSNMAAGTSATLNVMVWGLDANPVDARVRVFDAAGNAVAFQVLSNDRGLFSVQVLNAVAGKDYYIQVSARNPGGANSLGNYFLAADFNQITPLMFDAVGAGTVKPAATETGTLTLREAGLFQFALGATSQQAGAGVLMTVLDENGQVVFTLTATAGQPPVTATRYLKAGTYTIVYSGTKANTAAVNYNLFLLQLSEGVGPYATSTASPPSSTSPNPSPSDPSPQPTATTSAPPPPESAPPPSDTSSGGTTDPHDSEHAAPREPEPSYTYEGSSSRPAGYWYWY